MTRLAVINAVGLCGRALGPAMPRTAAWRDRTGWNPIRPAFPALTCTAQSDYLTGEPPAKHGVVGNGWYHRKLAEVHFWKQSNRLVESEKLWERLRRDRPDFVCAKLFWWFNMYSSADYSVTPRPMYPADGRKVFDIYAQPPELGARLKKTLGDFPFPTFWGPAAGQRTPQGAPDAVSRWIAEAAKETERHHRPDLQLIYLPHLDYNLQRFGPNDPRIEEDYRKLDEILGDLLDFFSREAVRVCLLSEYGIGEVSLPIHLNREFRKRGWLTVREELGLELLDCGRSRVFGVADHQICHVYLQDPSLESEVRQLIEQTAGVAEVLDRQGKRRRRIDHRRAGDLIAVAAPHAWFTYYYWLDNRRAPDFARCVDIHRKPGYDPVELFLDPKLSLPTVKIAWRLFQKKIGLRMLLDVIPLDAGLIKGSHGICPPDELDYPLMIGANDVPGKGPTLGSTAVFSRLLALLEQ